MIDNLLQNAKIDNAHYTLHEDFRPYDKPSKKSNKYPGEDTFSNESAGDQHEYVNEPRSTDTRNPVYYVKQQKKPAEPAQASSKTGRMRLLVLEKIL